MSDLNKWIGVGRLTADPKSHPVTGSGPMTTFTIAVNERYKQGETQRQSTNYVPIVTFGQLAASTAQFLKKGRQVLVAGKLCLEPYEDENQRKHVRASVKAEAIQYLAHPASTERSGEARAQE
jgi:single-strand DNA-binding protein